MNEVQPIKDREVIERMKQSLRGRDLLLFIVGINSSLRISDILTLTREDFAGDYVTLREKKTRKQKNIRINNAIKNAVATLAPPTGLLFISQKGEGKAISRVQAWRILNAAARRAGIDYAFGTHSLRKTFGYFAYKSGVDIALLMTTLNHSSQRETLRYIGIEQADVDSVYDAVDL